MSERPPALRLLWGQIRYQNRIFWRTPVSAFFTLVFPLMFLFVFTLLFGNDTIEELGVTTAQFYSPALAVFGAVSATYTNLAIGTAFSRDLGILKRVRGTPLPPWLYLAGRVGSAVWVAAIAIFLMLGVGIVLFGVTVYVETLPALIVSFLVGVSCFAALGLLIAALAPNGDSSPALANATLLPLAFISDIFIVSTEGAPTWIETLGNVFPLKHFARTFLDSFNPIAVQAQGSWLGQFHWADLGVMALWLAGGALLAARLFTWEPRGGERARSRRSLRRSVEATT